MPHESPTSPSVRLEMFGDVVIPEGASLRDADIHGRVRVAGSNATLINCTVYGGGGLA